MTVLLDKAIAAVQQLPPDQQDAIASIILEELEDSIAVIPLTMIDGVMRITGTRVTLDTVVGAFNDGATAEEIVQQYPSLSLADVYTVLGYYLHRKSRVDSYITERQQRAAVVRAQNEERFNPSGIREQLLARRQGAGEQ